MAEVVDVEKIPGGYTLVVKTKCGEEIRVNFNRKHFEKLTDEELERILREVDEHYCAEDEEPEHIRTKIAAIKGRKVE